MDQSRQNLTLVVEADIITSARKIASLQGTSVNQLVRDFLTRLVAESGRKRLARTRLEKMMSASLVEVGVRTWSRADLYER